MRDHFIISYEFTGKDFGNYVSSFTFSSDAENKDELADEILEAANEHAGCSFKRVVGNSNVCITNIFQIDDETNQL